MAKSIPFWVGGWVVLVVGMLLLRPPLPVDETRYLAVAWEMWWRHSQWIPVLNGAPYDGKPPLFFWLMELGWLVTGVNIWWARLVAPLFGLLALWLTRVLARRLWPQQDEVAALAPVLLLGTLYWALFSSATMFDMLLSAFALLAIYGLVWAWQGGGRGSFVLTGVGLGLGILAKGPVVFLPVAAVALLAPWWMAGSRPAALSWRRWYGGCLLAVMISALIALIWLVPMALQGGWRYFVDMTWHQTTGYVVESFSHRRPWWWYLPLLPFMLLPWTLWPETWRAGWRLGGLPVEPAVRLCLAWALPVFVIFCLISGKQPHYLLPLFPALALLLARGLSTLAPTPGRWPLPALFYLMLGLGWLVLPFAPAFMQVSTPWLRQVSIPLALVLALAFVALAVLVIWASHRLLLCRRVQLLAASMWLALLLMAGGVTYVSWPAYDLRPSSRVIAHLAAQGAPLAVLEHDHGQYNFFGRLKKPMVQIDPHELPQWAQAHPQGYVIAYYSDTRWPSVDAQQPYYQSLYRGGWMAVWPARELVQHPQLAAVKP